MEIEGTKIEFKVGDITEEESEAIVNPANSLMIMGGGVAGALKSKGGKEIEDEAVSHAPVEIGKAIITKAGKLKTKYIIHAPTMERPAMRTTKEKVFAATKAAISIAFQKGITMISIPAMGTGVGGLSYSEAAEAMIKAIVESIKEGKKLKKITIVLRDEQARKDFEEVFNRLV